MRSVPGHSVGWVWARDLVWPRVLSGRLQELLEKSASFLRAREVTGSAVLLRSQPEGTVGCQGPPACRAGGRGHTEEGGAKGERGKVSRCHLQRPECRPPGPLADSFAMCGPGGPAAPRHTVTTLGADRWPQGGGAPAAGSASRPHEAPRTPTPANPLRSSQSLHLAIYKSWLVSPHTGYEQREPGLLRPDPSERVCRRPAPSLQTPCPLPAHLSGSAVPVGGGRLSHTVSSGRSCR